MFLIDQPYFEHVYRVLARNGALTPEGWQISQADLALRCDIKARNCFSVLRKMKQLDLLTAEPHRGFGEGDRQADTLRLKVTVAEFAKLRPKLAAQERERRQERMVVAQRMRRMEQQRMLRRAERVLADEQRKPPPAAPPPVPVDAAAVSVLAGQMDDDEDLAGW